MTARRRRSRSRPQTRSDPSFSGKRVRLGNRVGGSCSWRVTPLWRYALWVVLPAELAPAAHSANPAPLGRVEGAPGDHRDRDGGDDDQHRYPPGQYGQQNQPDDDPADAEHQVTRHVYLLRRDAGIPLPGTPGYPHIVPVPTAQPGGNPAFSCEDSSPTWRDR